MFQKSLTDKRRVIIVDVTHLFYKYQYGTGGMNLSTTIIVDGVPKIVNTNLATLTIKALHRWANGGYNPLVVCFDGAGCAKSRKAYFTKESQDKSAEPVAYKSTRDSQNSSFYEDINLTMNLLLKGGVTCLKAEGYEADDLIKAAVDKAKIDYPNLPIDIITSDQDLLPLVDEQVSVFIQSKKLTWAESKDIEKRNYFQVTPDTYQDYIEGLSEFKGLNIPYNCALLKKLLRGKKADNVPAYPKFTPTKFNNLVDSLIEDGYDLSELFRYDLPIVTIKHKVTGMELTGTDLENTPVDMRVFSYTEPPTLTKMCRVLGDYLDSDIVDHIRMIYNGVNLNGAFQGLGQIFDRRPARITSQIKGYDFSTLAQAVSILKINLPVI